MHTTLSRHHFWTQSEIEQITNAWLIENKIEFGQFKLVTTTLNKEWILQNQGQAGLNKHLEELGNNTNVAIAAAVTSYSRIILNEYKLLALKLGLKLYYSDTDSLVLNGPLPENVIDSATLGKLNSNIRKRD
jgi:hypothetical protein